jgi:CRISPR-associated protein Cst2
VVTQQGPIFSLAVSARAVINMHSLNNEGGEGNQITTRFVNIVRPDGNGGHRIDAVNAISGDMFKHIQAEHLWHKLQESGPLCNGCRTFSSGRILDDTEFIGALPARDSDTIDQLLQRCVVDDLEGTLVARGARSIPRKSVVEFGWVIGIPEYTTTDSYFHVRYAQERGERGDDQAQQAIFHRPASSGVYGVVCKAELSRIGHNDILQRPALDSVERRRRCRLLLESLRDTFLEPNGAMRGTQDPHMTDLAGVVTVSRGPIPAPAWSPLADDYLGQVEGIVAALESGHPGMVSARRFTSAAEFASLMAEFIANAEPAAIGLRE